MDLNIDFISREFDRINDRHFEGKLLKPRFEITHVRSYLGQYHWKYSYNDDIFFDSVIRISDMFDRSNEDIINTLAHEMIHLFIRQNKIKDRRSHGTVFYAVANRLNREGGFHIARTDDIAGCGLRNNTGKEFIVGCYYSAIRGRYFQFVMNKNKVNYYIGEFEANPYHYKNPFIFKSNDDKAFAHFPVCRSAIRGGFITKAEYDRRLKEENVIHRFVSLSAR